MPDGSKDLVIGFPLFQDADLLDVMIPLEALGFLSQPNVRTVRTLLVGPGVGQPVRLQPGGTEVLAQAGFADEESRHLDVLIVPGGTGLVAAMGDEAYLAFLRERAATARHVEGVCAGALALAAAGLLNGHLATTHWASLSALGLFPQVTVAPGYPRWVVSGKVITTGGVTSALDMAIALCALLGGEDQARRVQLLLQYAPRPPYDAGDPAAADPVSWDQASRDLERLRQERLAFVRKLLGLRP